MSINTNETETKDNPFGKITGATAFVVRDTF